ncbi:MAG: hypothetical protein NTW14_07325 [bacterium]|nr:hypothetical protein [bacterium]
MKKFYTQLIVREKNDQFSGRAKGWEIELEENPYASLKYSNDKPAKEIVIYSRSEERAQYAIDLIVASQCILTGVRMLQESPSALETNHISTSYLNELITTNKRILQIPLSDLNNSTSIAIKASFRRKYGSSLFQMGKENLSLPAMR